MARAYGHFFPDTRVDAVELDGALTAIGKRYFHLSGPRLHLYTADARPWLQASHARYDSIFMDAYRQPYIPFYLVTRQFFASARAHLRPAGRSSSTSATSRTRARWSGWSPPRCARCSPTSSATG